MPTLSSDPLQILLISDEWGTRQVLERCLPVTRDQFHQPFPIGLGSLHAVTTHIVSVMRRWADRIEDRSLRPSLLPIPGRPDIACQSIDRSPQQLLELLTDAGADLRAVASKWTAIPGGLATTLHLDWPRKEGGMKRYTFTRGCCLTHVGTHGHYHRAQCMNMLRHLGIKGVSDNLPETEAIDWQAQVESPAVILS